MTLVSNNAYVSTSALYCNDSYLEHHGIKGQKWGVRRFQNEDGSLKAAGEKRYGVGEGVARRALAGVYSINEKAYNRLGNKTLASMNKAAKERQLALAKKADPNRDKRVSERKEKVNAVIKKERDRGQQLGKHAVLKSGLRYTAITTGNAFKSGLVATGVKMLTNNENLAAAAGGAFFVAAQARPTIELGRNFVDRGLYTGNKGYTAIKNRRKG